jgi:molecular chaperone Hsp33
VGRNGLVSVIRDLGLRENFSGQVAIATGEIDEDVERYLGDSEQIVSALACDAVVGEGGDIGLAAGLLVQALPGSDGAEAVAVAQTLLRGGTFAQALADKPATAEELIQASIGDALGAVQVLDRRPVRFFCPCSRERARATLELLGEAELGAMILEDGQAEVICNFCNAHYNLDATELEEIRRKTRGPSAPPS